MSDLSAGKISATTGFKLPIFNNSNRPTGEQGLMIFNSDTQAMEIYNGTSWSAFNFAQDGSTPARAATSAASILALNPNAQDGLYYIDFGGSVGPQLTYCDMTNYGGGWMLAMRIDSTLGTGTVRHYADPNWWADATSGVTGAPTIARTNGEYKGYAYTSFQHSDIMLEYGYGNFYFNNLSRVWYTQPPTASGNNPNQINQTMLHKMINGYHEGGGYTVNGYTTQQNRWARQATNDATFFPATNLHINYGSHAYATSNSNDFFRLYFNNQPDTDTDGNSCNQVGGFGMCGDFNLGQPSPRNATFNPSLATAAYSAGNASGTISPPYGSVYTSCQWNGSVPHAGSSGEIYNNQTTKRPSAIYFDNGVGLIWVR